VEADPMNQYTANQLAGAGITVPKFQVADGRIVIEIPGDPIGAPRMTRRDKWAKRPVVVRFMAWRNALENVRRVLPNANRITSFSWTAYFAPPATWSAKKRAEHLGKLHRSKPDRDNIDKALLDGLFAEDKGIAHGTIRKVWDATPRIEIEIQFE
jgi:Holliday junction resolvase RusA-like endonuclease